MQNNKYKCWKQKICKYITNAIRPFISFKSNITATLTTDGLIHKIPPVFTSELLGIHELVAVMGLI
eukprot:UN08396